MILLLGAFAGLTIFLGLPLAFLRSAPQGLRMFLNMLAAGVLLFLLFDVLVEASEPVEEALTGFSHGESVTPLLTYMGLLVGGLALGLLSLVYFNMVVRSRAGASARGSAPRGGTAPGDSDGGVPVANLAMVGAGEMGAAALPAALPATSAAPMIVATTSDLAPRTLALIIAIGIGLHNFSEGLAIGQSAASGALALATLLIIGFALHNMTEGFGIAGPLSGQRVSWPFILLLGFIAGGPTFLGTVVGIQFQSTEVFAFFLSLAAGAIIFVLAELLAVAKRFKRQDIVMWGLLVGFLLGYATDLIIGFAGA
jgi:ZIP family zinc transporter